MNAIFLTPPTTDRVLTIIRGELTSPRRWFYRAVLLVASIMTAGILSLWTTEPEPLPLRLHIAFGALSAIGLAWITVLTWILWRQQCPTALDRIATGWVALGACTLFLAVAVPIAVLRGESVVAAWLCILGAAMWSVAAMMLWSAYALRRELVAKLVEMEGRE